MTRKYKLILSNREFYREVRLPRDMQDAPTLSVGTSKACDLRLRAEMFPHPFGLVLQPDGARWRIFCDSENLYLLSVGHSTKEISHLLEHGDEVSVRYDDSNLEVLSLSFLIDFEDEKRDYRSVIYLGNRSQVRIGGDTRCDIRVVSEYVGTDCLTLDFSGEPTVLVDRDSRYGIYLDGERIAGRAGLPNRSFLFIADCGFYYKERRLYTSSGQRIELRNGLSAEATEVLPTTNFRYPRFRRNTRIRYVIPERTLEIKAPPAMPTRPKQHLLLTIAPSVVILLLMILIRGLVGGGGLFVLYGALVMLSNIVTKFLTYNQESEDDITARQARREAYRRYEREKKAEIQDLQKEELEARERTFEPLDKSAEEVRAFGRRLFERSPGDSDFLQVYLGRGRIASSIRIQYEQPDFPDPKDELQGIPEQIAANFRYLDEAPVVADFLHSDAVGVVGNAEALEAFLINLTLDLAIRHFYRDVKLAYLLDDATLARLRWLRWLRNTEEEGGLRNIAEDEISRTAILENLFVLLTAPEQRAPEQYYVVFVRRSAFIRGHLISRHIKGCSSRNFTFVFLEEHEEDIPQGCQEIVRLENRKTGSLVRPALGTRGDAVTTFGYEQFQAAEAEKIALRLGAVRVEEASLESDLTKSITLFELLKLYSAEDLDVRTKWAESRALESLAAPIGVKRKGEIVSLNILDGDAAHGPHGLVAGTTGSGKSEILQTYILSMAVHYSPEDVAFLLIDYKAGGMSGQFEGLPHLVGTITNIGNSIQRSLVSIQAELDRRGRLFSRYRVNNIKDYIRAYKERKKRGDNSDPLPHLIIIVDEFSELKDNEPDFMDTLISISRTGRSLGIHLILATQRPFPAVSGDIASNARFKLCLRVQSVEESKSVLNSPLAAEIREAGRAYFQVGNNEIFELFQSAYSGAEVPEGHSSRDNVYSIYRRSLSGARTEVYSNRKRKPDGESKRDTQLKAVVGYLRDYCRQNHVPKLPDIYPPLLEDRIPVEALDFRRPENDIAVTVPIGVYDDPARQRQGEVCLDFSHENVYVLGLSQSGKTVLIQTVLYGLTRKYTPEEVNVYLIDCGSRTLKIYEHSRHVGGVILPNEREKYDNFLKMLNRIIDRRKGIFSEAGLSNHAAYCAARRDDPKQYGEPMPLLVVVIDNMDAFRESFPDEDIAGLSREAQGAGISLLITATSPKALSSKIALNFEEKLILHSDEDTYKSLGRKIVTPKDTPGRGLCLLEKRVLEFQTAAFGVKPDGDAEELTEARRTAKIRAWIEARNGEVRLAKRAPGIPVVPKELPLAEWEKEFPEKFADSGRFLVGMRYEPVEDAYLDASGTFSLAGDAERRRRFVRMFLKMVSRRNMSVDRPMSVFLVDDSAAKLKDCASYGFVRYASDARDGASLVRDFSEQAEEVSADATPALILLNADAAQKISQDSEDKTSLLRILNRAEELGAFVFMAFMENEKPRISSGELSKWSSERKKGFIFAPLREHKFFDPGVSRAPSETFDDTMAYLYDGTGEEPFKIKSFSE